MAAPSLASQNAAEVAQRLGLPADAPVGAIGYFLKSRQSTRGDTKTQSLTKEQKKKAEDAIIQYMESRGLEFLQVQGDYLVIKSETKPEGWSNQLVGAAYMAFHSQPQQGNPPQVAERFVNFCNQLRKQRGETAKSLGVSKKRPFRAVLQGMLNGPNSLGQL